MRKTPETLIHKVKIGNYYCNLLRDADIRSDTGGNKVWKLQQAVEQAARCKKAVCSIGGAYSNSLLAIAALAHSYGIPSIGIVRGEELASQVLNPYLHKATHGYSMRLEFVSRKIYRDEKLRQEFIQQVCQASNAVFLAEGGASLDGYKGVKDFFSRIDLQAFDTIFLPVGTGTSFAGLISSLTHNSRVYGVLVVNDQMRIASRIESFWQQDSLEVKPRRNFCGQLLDAYTCGGFAKSNPELRRICMEFSHDNLIPLDARYTGKSLLAMKDFFDSGRIENPESSLLIHTGGVPS